MTTAYVNGEFLPLARARVSVLDRGFLFGDSVYEVIPVYAGVCFRLGAHLARLGASLDGIGMADPLGPARWRELVERLVAANGGGDLAVYLQVTRGACARRDHRIPDHAEATIVAFCQSRPAPAPEILRDGIAAVTQADNRWQHCAIKSTSLLANVLAADAARREGATEALLVRDGCVLEGSSSNVFAVIAGRLVTPALRATILAGITRAAVLELAAAAGIDYAEVDVLSPTALAAAEEVWITSSTREIFAVTRLDGRRVGDGRPGVMHQQLRKRLQAASNDPEYS